MKCGEYSSTDVSGHCVKCCVTLVGLKLLSDHKRNIWNYDVSAVQHVFFSFLYSETSL